MSVELRVLEPPTTARLYFWALQADFADSAGRAAGGAHCGLQWHPGHADSTAANWGGYHAGGGELPGSRSPLPSKMDNANTRDFAWRAGTTYRLWIHPAGEAAPQLPPGPPPGTTAWRCTITDLGSGEATVLRDLYVQGEHLTGAIVWSEVFARCDDPSVSVLWSQPSGLTTRGDRVTPLRASVNYQSHADGGCANTNSFPVDGAEAVGLVQQTNCSRETPQGTMLAWPRRGSP